MKRLSDQTLYEILEVPPGAPAAEIEAAYERVRSLYAPGSLATYALMSSEEADLLARRIEEAKATLLDSAARARYDESLAHREPEPPAQASGSPPAGPVAPRIARRRPRVIPALAVEPPEPDEPEDSEDVEEHGEPGVPDEQVVRHEQAGPGEPARAAALLAGAVATAGPPAETARPAAPRTGAAATGASPDEAARPAAPRAGVAGTGGPHQAPPRRPILLEREVAAEVPPPKQVASAPPRAPEPPIPEVAEWTGEALRLAREARGMTVQQVAERTKVTRHHIENIEAERFGALPAPVYLRGILLAVARELRLDGQRVARSYLERAAAAAPAPTPKPR